MHVIVAIKQVPDLVEELEINDDGTDVDREFIKFVTNEWDEQALEEALLIKDATGATVTVVALDDQDVDQALYTAMAKGADTAVKLEAGASEAWIDSHRRAKALAAWIGSQSYDLVLSGVQAPDDLDGQMPPLLARELGVPYVAVVVAVEAKDGAAKIVQEFGGGISAEVEVRLPAVIGVQAARQAPRYAAITRVRQAMQAGGLQTSEASLPADGSGLTVRRLYAPERATHAEMLSGSAGAVAGRIVELLRSRGLIA
jgi:electron transfer flavoprotein beta subunit